MPRIISLLLQKTLIFLLHPILVVLSPIFSQLPSLTKALIPYFYHPFPLQVSRSSYYPNETLRLQKQVYQKPIRQTITSPALTENSFTRTIGEEDRNAT